MGTIITDKRQDVSNCMHWNHKTQEHMKVKEAEDQLRSSASTHSLWPYPLKKAPAPSYPWGF